MSSIFDYLGPYTINRTTNKTVYLNELAFNNNADYLYID